MVRLTAVVFLAALVGIAGGVLTVRSPDAPPRVAALAAPAAATAEAALEPALRPVGLPAAGGLAPETTRSAAIRTPVPQEGVAGAVAVAGYIPPAGVAGAPAAAPAAAPATSPAEFGARRDLAGGVTFAIESSEPTPAAPSGDYSVAPADPGPPLQIADVHLTSLTPYAATIAWTTSEGASGRVAYGLDAPVLWSAADAPRTEHQAQLTSLEPGKEYHLAVESGSADGRAATSDFVLTTPPRAAGPFAGSVAGGALLVDGHPFFPTIVWAQCSDGYGGNLDVGINVFMGNGCGDATQQLARLGDRALSVGALDDAAQGLVGRYLPDEWDTHLPNDFSLADVRRVTGRAAGPEPTFLTLTNHFYSLAEPLPQGRGMYPALAAGADVLGFDLYPLQNWCRLDSFGDVFDAQRQLVELAAGKPTFQWIEARRMDCTNPALDPTPETLRAEVWLSVAAGAHGVGYFPNNWSADVGDAIARVDHELDALAPALLAPPAAASADGPVRVGARVRNGAVYVIAVNPKRAAATATIRVPAVGDRTLAAIDGSRTVDAKEGSFTDSFAPLEVHVYVVRPDLS